MWPFGSREAPQVPADLEERLEKAERAIGGLRLDYDDLFERFRRLQGRFSKRGELSPQPEPDRAPESQPELSLNGLTPRQLEIDAAIRARRAGGRGLPRTG
jgi:hypothetical protein